MWRDSRFHNWFVGFNRGPRILPILVLTLSLVELGVFTSLHVSGKVYSYESMVKNKSGNTNRPSIHLVSVISVPAVVRS